MSATDHETALEAAKSIVFQARCADDSAAWGRQRYSIEARHLDALVGLLQQAERERDEALIVREGLISPVQKVVQLKARVRVLEGELRGLREWADHRKRGRDVNAEWEAEIFRGVDDALAAAAPPSEPPAAVPGGGDTE